MHREHAHVVFNHWLAPLLCHGKWRVAAGLGPGCTWTLVSDGGSFPNTASEEHRLVADGHKRSLHGAAFHSARWPQHEAAQCSFQADSTKPHKARIPPPTDPCIHLFLQTPPAHCWRALWQLWMCREVSFTGWGGVTSDCMRLGFFLELHQGKPKEPSKTFGLGNPAPGGRSMPQADGKTSFQSAGAKASSQNSSDTQQTSNNPEWTLCPDWLCVPITLCVPPPRLTLPSSAVLSAAARRCCCPQLIQGII